MNINVKELVSLGEGNQAHAPYIIFIDAKNTRHKLTFGIDHQRSDTINSDYFYSLAVLESTITAKTFNRVTCLTSPTTVVRKTPLSWQNAQSILQACRPLIETFTLKDIATLDTLEQIATSKNHSA